LVEAVSVCLAGIPQREKEPKRDAHPAADRHPEQQILKDPADGQSDRQPERKKKQKVTPPRG